MATKYQKIASSIRTKINEGIYPCGTLLPTEQELCDTYSVSRQTVRQALHVLVNENLIERHQGRGSKVLAISPDIPVVRKSRTIAVIITYIDNYIFPTLLREIESVLSSNGYSTLLFATQNQISLEHKILLDLLAMPDLQGIIVEGTKTALPNPNLNLYRQLQNKNIPLVFVNGIYHDLNHTLSVLDDNYGGAYQLVQYLHSKGHQKIAGIFKFDDMQGHQRYAGYLAALRNLNLPINDNIIFWFGTESLEINAFLSPEHEIWNKLDAAVVRDFTAIICYCDGLALPVLHHFQKQNIKIPDEIAIVSFDNYILDIACPLGITTLSHEAQNPGRVAAELLIKLKNNIPCQSQIIPWTLIEKESS